MNDRVAFAAVTGEAVLASLMDAGEAPQDAKLMAIYYDALTRTLQVYFQTSYADKVPEGTAIPRWLGTITGSEETDRRVPRPLGREGG